MKNAYFGWLLYNKIRDSSDEVLYGVEVYLHKLLVLFNRYTAYNNALVVKNS